ncbi:hypothetical protein ABZ570_03435 [Micromonospora sp. NPDC007271]|uniref:hypothetical protein n=1 Tax=Micromonospora sp. NPDC007271 TaxID=3154587 RepID=UPI0033D01E35
MVERLQSECRGQRFELSAAAAEDIVAELVNKTARSLGMREETVLSAHLGTVDVAALAADIVRADERQKREVRGASPAIISVEDTGRLVASLAQAVRCVSLNHARLTHGGRDKWDVIGVLDDASNSLTLVGEALEKHHAAPHVAVVLWSDESVVYARRALARTIEKLRAGDWSFGHGAKLDAGVTERMTADLKILSPD